LRVLTKAQTFVFSEDDDSGEFTLIPREVIFKDLKVETSDQASLASWRVSVLRLMAGDMADCIFPCSAISTKPMRNLSAPLAEKTLNLIALERLAEDSLFHAPNRMARGRNRTEGCPKSDRSTTTYLKRLFALWRASDNGLLQEDFFFC
jgi:hypothetical protein